MPINAGSVFINLNARSAQFVRNVNTGTNAITRQRQAAARLRRQVRSVTDVFVDWRKSLAAVSGAVALLAGARGIGNLIRQQAQYGATLLENSRQVGINVEFIQLLGRAYQGEGGNLDRFNKALIQFSRAVAEAHRGTTTYTDQFDLLGVTIHDAAGRIRPASELFDEIADGLQRLEDPALRVNAVFNLFGARNIALLNVLRNGSTELHNQINTFRQFGVVTQSETVRLKALEQSYTDLSTAVSTVLAKAVAEAATSLEKLNSSLAERVPGAIDVFVSGIRRIIEGLDELRNIGIAVGLFFGIRFIRNIVVASGGLRAMATAAIAARVGLSALLGPAGIIIGGLTALNYFISRTDEAVTTLENLERVRRRVDQGAQFGSNLEDRQRDLQDAIRLTRSRINQLQEDIVTYYGTWRQANAEKLIDDATQELQRYRGELSRVQEQINENRTPDIPALPPAPSPRQSQAQRDPTAGLLPAAIGELSSVQQQLDALGRAPGEARRLSAEIEAASRIARTGGTFFDHGLWQRLADLIEGTTIKTEELEEAQRRIQESGEFQSFVRQTLQDLDGRREILEATLGAIRGGQGEGNIAALEAERQFSQEILDLEDKLISASGEYRVTLQERLQTLQVIQGETQRLADLEETIDIARQTRQALDATSVESIRAQFEAQTQRIELENSLVGLGESQKRVAQENAAILERITDLRGLEQIALRQGNEEDLASIRERIELLEQGINLIGEEARKRREIVENQRQANQDLIEAERERGRFIEQISSTISNGLSQAILHAESLRGVFKGILATVIQIAARIAITRVLTSLLGGGGDIAGRQLGGPVSRGRPYLVGERGAELFVPGQSGQVIPNHQIMGRMGEGGGNVTLIQEINVQSTDGPGVEAAFQRILPRFQEETIQASRQLVARDLGRPSIMRP